MPHCPSVLQKHTLLSLIGVQPFLFYTVVDFKVVYVVNLFNREKDTHVALFVNTENGIFEKGPKKKFQNNSIPIITPQKNTRPITSL